MQDTDASDQIDAFVSATRALEGKEIDEGRRWNALVTADAIRHFAVGTSDANPLWIDPEYAKRSHFGRLVAPPAFLSSVCYPVLHGSPVPAPLSSLIGEIGFEWFHPVLEGDELGATSVQKRVYEARERSGRRLVCIESETSYRNQRDERVGVATGTLVRVEQKGAQLLNDRRVHHYEPDEIEEIARAIRSEERAGAALLDPDALVEGDAIPTLVRPPMTIGDLVCWQAAAGTSYRPGSLGYLDSLAAPHHVTLNPVTGWPVKYSQQHEDMNLNAQRGMPAPFDNGVMRLAWVAPLLTNWIGDRGFLKRLRLNLKEPVLYGDASWYRARITQKVEVEDGVEVALRVEATNQLGIMTTTGDALVWLPVPRKAALSLPGSAARSAENESAPLSAADRQRILVDWNATTTDVPRDHSAHGLFEACAADTPGACAIRASERSLSYAELDAAANRLAHRLSGMVRRGELVCVRMQRSPEAVVAMLGVLKAGAGYLPIDPENPRDLLGSMAPETRPTLLLTEQRLHEDFAAHGTPTILVDTDPSLADESAARPEVEVDGDDVAYAITTSGSLGLPKVVAVSHGSLALYLQSISKPLGVDSSDVFLHTASFGFSAAVRQTWLPLSLGATLVMAGSKERADPVALFRRIAAAGVTVWDTVPSWCRQCIDTLARLDAGAREGLLEHSLRRVLLTGERLAWDVVKRWRDDLGQSTPVLNLYSQTETSGTACVYTAQDEPGPGSSAVPIGRPVDNTLVYVLDESLQPLAPGRIGEICVGGDRIATGYVGDAAATAEKFVPNPFVAAPKARLYRTGDLGRFDETGCLEHLGRLDRRVDIRGFRVELGEIEAVLQRHPQIGDAAVVYRDEGAGRSRLVAYCVAEGGAPPSLRELHESLRTRLPAYMLPATTVWLDALPRTASGKLDARALPEPSRARPALDDDYAAPATSEEKELAALWARALGLDSVGVEDDFFELGGDSLRAVELMVEVEQQFGTFHPLELLYDAPTVRAFAGRIAGAGASGLPPGVVPLQPEGDKPPLFWLPGGGGHSFAFRDLCQRIGDEQPSYGFTLPGLDGREAPLDSVEGLAAHFIAKARSVQPEGPLGLVGYSFGGTVAYEMARQLRAAGEDVRILALIDARSRRAVTRRPFAARMQVHRVRWSRLGTRERWHYLVDRLRRLVARAGPQPEPGAPDGPEPSTEIQAAMRRVRVAQQRATSRYRARAYDGRLLLFCAEPPDWMDFAELDPSYGWGELCAGGVERHDITGRHLEVFEAPHAEVLARSLQEALSRAA